MKRLMTTRSVVLEAIQKLEADIDHVDLSIERLEVQMMFEHTDPDSFDEVVGLRQRLESMLTHHHTALEILDAPAEGRAELAARALFDAEKEAREEAASDALGTPVPGTLATIN